MVLHRRYAIGALLLIATTAAAFQFAWWKPVAGGGFTPPQDGNIQVRALFGDGIVYDSGNGDYGPTNYYYAGTVNDSAPIFWWVGEGAAKTNELGSGNLVGENTNASDAEGLRLPRRGSSPSSPALALTNWTMCCWIYPDTIGSGDWFVGFDTAAMRMYEAGGNLRCYVNGVYASTTLPSEDAWVHIAITYDNGAGSAIHYINGSPVVTNSTTFVAGNPFITVARWQAAGRGLHSKYDDIYVWDVKLTSSEVNEMVDQGDPSTRSE